MRGGRGSGSAPGLLGGAAGVCRADPGLGSELVTRERQGRSSQRFLTLLLPEGGGKSRACSGSRGRQGPVGPFERHEREEQGPGEAERALGRSRAPAGPGALRTSFSLPSPLAPGRGGAGALGGRELCVASCLLSGFEKRREVVEDLPSPLPSSLLGKTRLGNGFNGVGGQGLQPRQPAPGGSSFWGLMTPIVFWQVRRQGVGKKDSCSDRQDQGVRQEYPPASAARKLLYKQEQSSRTEPPIPQASFQRGACGA